MLVRIQRCVLGDKDACEETKMRRMETNKCLKRQRCVGGDIDASEETKMCLKRQRCV